MSKDEDTLHDLVDDLQGVSFHAMVVEEIAKLRGVPLTEAFRREWMAKLRNETSVLIKEMS